MASFDGSSSSGGGREENDTGPPPCHRCGGQGEELSVRDAAELLQMEQEDLELKLFRICRCRIPCPEKRPCGKRCRQDTAILNGECPLFAYRTDRRGHKGGREWSQFEAASRVKDNIKGHRRAELQKERSQAQQEQEQGQEQGQGKEGRRVGTGGGGVGIRRFDATAAIGMWGGVVWGGSMGGGAGRGVARGMPPTFSFGEERASGRNSLNVPPSLICMQLM